MSSQQNIGFAGRGHVLSVASPYARGAPAPPSFPTHRPSRARCLRNKILRQGNVSLVEELKNVVLR